jgi:predicted flap endonuclease-1-like 5' DNA nuclease
MKHLAEIEQVGSVFAKKLAAAGINSVEDLFENCATRLGRAKVAKATGISENLILKWAKTADLMRIDGVGPEHSELIEAAGVGTVEELKDRNAQDLASKMKEVNEVRKLVRLSPSASLVAAWIKQAEGLETKLEVSTDGEVIIITRSKERTEKLKAGLEAIHARYAGVFRRLAE